MNNRFLKQAFLYVLATLMVLSSIPMSVFATTKLSITTQPKSVTVESGEKATVKVIANGTGLKYKWYFKDEDASKYSLTTSFTGNTYSMTMSSEKSGRFVYCVITDSYNNSVKTATVSLNMQKSLKITAQPKSVTTENGKMATLKVIAEGKGLSYKWYSKDVGESSYSLEKNVTGEIYSVTMSNAVSGRLVYCVIADSSGKTAKSNTVYLKNTALELEITKQPESVIKAIGETVTLSVKADGILPKYMWQSSKDGTNWTNLNKTTASYSFIASSDSFKTMYRCKVSDNYGNTVISNAVKPQNADVLILEQPKNWKGCEDGDAFFEVVALDTVDNYVWQYSRDGGESWSTSSVNKPVYSTTASSTNDGRLYRCTVSDSSGRKQISDVVSLKTSSTFEITSQPKTESVDFGEKATFSIVASGRSITFKWQYSKDKKIWTDLGQNSARASQTLHPSNTGRYYRCIVTNSNGDTKTSNIVQIKWKNTGFYKSESKIYYIKSDGTLASGLETLDGKIYYFKDNLLRTGLREISGKTYYFTKEGPAAIGFTYVPDLCGMAYFYKDGHAASGWTTIDSKQYYFYESGAMAWGITQIGSGEYFFDQKTGVRTYGFVQIGINDYMYFQENKTTPYVGLKTIDDELYYFAKEGRNQGIAQGGKQTVDGKTYYFDPITKQALKGLVELGDNIYLFGEDYVMDKNGLAKYGSKTYLLDSKGALCYGLVKHNGKRYYLDPETGVAVSGWVDLDGTKLYFDSKTYAAKTGVDTISGIKYSFNSNGYLNTGVLKSDGIRYYFSDKGNNKTGFVNINNKTYYVYSNQKLATGLKTINKKLYYFDSNGIMRTGLRNVGGKRYYFDPDKGYAVTGFVKMSNGNTYYFNGTSGSVSGLKKIGGKLYCFNSSGIMRYGRIEVKGNTYYFDPETGEAKSGWQNIVCSNNTVRKAYFDPKTYRTVTGAKKIGGKLYYFDSSGWAKSGLRTVKGKTCFFSPTTYEAYKGWYKNKDGTQSYFNGANGKIFGPKTFKIGGKKYFIDAYGRRKNSKKSDPVQSSRSCSWKTVKGSKYYYGMNGKALKGLQVIDGDLYYFDKNGKMKTGLVNVNGSKYYFTKSGAKFGAVKINGKEYYFSPTSCEMLTGLIKVSGKFRYYQESGIRKTGWIKNSDDERLYIKSNGLQTGLTKIGGKTYYFGEDGIIRTGVQQVTNSKGSIITCLFGSDGAMVTGLVKNSKGYYYYNPTTGARTTGFLKINNKEYYFDPNSGIAKKGICNISGKYYYFDLTTAQRKTGLQKVGKKLYCFNDTSTGLAKGITTVNGKKYYFSNASGIALTGYREVNDVKYYFDPSTGASISKIHRRADGSAYSFKAGGGVNTGWVKVGSNLYYFYPSTGIMAEGLASVKDKLYYFDYNNGILKNTEKTVGGVTYKFDSNGYGSALGNSNLSKIINEGIRNFEKGYGSNEGKEEPENFTCSQLITDVFATVGIDLPKRSARQYSALVNGDYNCEVVESIDHAKAGDLIFFTTVNCDHKEKCDFWNEIHHIGVYLGDGKILESYEIIGDSDNNGPMIRDMQDDISSIIFKFIRINGVND